VSAAGTTSAVEIELPHHFALRDYQRPVFEAFDDGIRRFCEVWHRRSGKDKTFWNLLIREAATGRVGNYWYVFPSYAQGRKAVWDAIDRDGYRVRDHAPAAALAGKPNETEMSLAFTSGSTLQIVGSDKVDSLVGTNPVGVVFSEYALQSPSVWQYLSPILIENGGWAAMNFTPRGDNHARDLYERALLDPAHWHCQLLTIHETHALDAAQIAEAKASMSEEVFRQEYLCDWAAGNQGAYYGRLLAAALDGGRITSVPVDPRWPVHTAWDLGVGDATAIWFWQVSPAGDRRFVDFYEASGEGLPHYAAVLQQRGYVYGKHYAPHDIAVKEWAGGVTRIEAARGLGIRFDVVPRQTVEDGIEAARLLIPRAWFDAARCKRGLECLRAYHKEFDETRQAWRERPEHDWSSHAADAFRYGALSKVEVANQGQYTAASGRRARPW